MHVPADTECEVLYEGVWCRGRIAEWRRDQNGHWSAWVRYTDPAGGNRIDVLPSERVRPRKDA